MSDVAVTLTHSNDVAVSLNALSLVPVVTLTPAEDSPSVVIYDNAGGVLDPASHSVQVALQAFMQGSQGPAGPVPQFSITVHTLNPGDDPTVDQGGTALNPTLDFGIPTATGVAKATLVVTAIGDTTIDQPVVTIGGTPTAPSVNIAIPILSPEPVLQFTAGASGSQVVQLTATPTSRAHLLINGLRQDSVSFSVAGSTLTISAGAKVMAGDFVQFFY